MCRTETCQFCNYEIPVSSDRCPNCARPSLFPNVKAAENPAEKAALDQRHQQAFSQTDPAAIPVVQQFEAATAQQSQAVIARYSSDVYTFASSDRNLYPSFYQLLQAGARLPADNFWDKVRPVIDEKLFPYYKDHIRFAALSLDGRGLGHYGDCFMVLKEDIIAHRATVFEENSIVFVHRRQLPETADMPPGYRAIWENRGRLAVAKLAHAIDANTTETDFPALLLRNGATSDDDDFIEVHILVE
jgi:hypothetical protein